MAGPFVGILNEDKCVEIVSRRVEIHDLFFLPLSRSRPPLRQKLQVLAEWAAPAGDLSEEVDEVQSCGAKPPEEEEGYDADSESNPEDMAKQEEGRSTSTFRSFNPSFFTRFPPL